MRTFCSNSYLTEESLTHSFISLITLESFSSAKTDKRKPQNKEETNKISNLVFMRQNPCTSDAARACGKQWPQKYRHFVFFLLLSLKKYHLLVRRFLKLLCSKYCASKLANQRFGQVRDKFRDTDKVR